MVVQPTEMMGVHLGVRNSMESPWDFWLENRRNGWLKPKMLLKITQLVKSGGWVWEADLLPPRSRVGLFLYHSLSKDSTESKHLFQYIFFSVNLYLCTNDILTTIKGIGKELRKSQNSTSPNTLNTSSVFICSCSCSCSDRFVCMHTFT